jgi:phosphoribosylanthranilate isomerase
MVKVKVCGLTNLEDAVVAVEAGADLLGFIFHPKSPRYVETAAVSDLLTQLRARRRDPLPTTVGVFVNESAERVAAILAQTGLDLAQLHGDEDPATVAALGGHGFKALRPVSADEAMAQAARYSPLPAADAPQLMIDAYSPTAFGGTGMRGDWALAHDLAACVPRLLLAGGLTPENVAEAIAAVTPWGVDVSSGVEAAPGRKDPAKVRAFVAAAHGANRPG